MKPIFLILITFCFLANIEAQNVTADKVYLHTDREFYVAGEPILFKLTVQDVATRQPSASKMGYIVLRNGNSKSIATLRVQVDIGEANGSILLPDTLSSGVYQLVAFTNRMRNNGENGYFYRSIAIVNQSESNLDTFADKSQAPTSSGQLKITCDSSQYKPCQKVKVKIEAVAAANLSVSVFESAAPSLGLQSSSAEFLPEQSTIKERYLLEIKGNILSGEVVGKASGEKIRNATVLLSRIDTVPNLQYAVTDSDGVFHFFLSNYYDGKELFLTLLDVPKNAGWKITVEDKFALSRKFEPVTLHNLEPDFIAKSQNIFHVNKSYEIENYNMQSKKQMQAPAPQFYYTPAKTLYPADYVSLNNFSEIVTELFPFLSIRRNAGNAQIRVLGVTSEQFINRGPAMFLDGIFVDDINKIFELGSDAIRKIDVLYSERVFGDLVFQGMVSVITKGNVLQTLQPADYSLRTMNPAIGNAGFLTANTLPPDKTRNKPYVKQLLYWNPTVKIADGKTVDIEFFTSENCGTYTFKAEGFSADGSPVSATSSFEVK